MSTIDTFRRLLPDTERLSHAYIAGVGLADTLAAAGVCSSPDGPKPCMACKACDKASRRIHPDISFVGKPRDKRDIIVDQIRELKKDALLIPTESARKVYVINNAELMNISSQNAFLRILEEPPSYVLFILSTDKPSALLTTVRSRCVELTSRVEECDPDPGTGAAELAEALFTALEQGDMQLNRFMFRLDKLDKEACGGFIAAARVYAVKKLSSGQSGPGPSRESIARLVRALDKADEMLDMNVSAGHVSGLICATMLKRSEDLH